MKTPVKVSMKLQRIAGALSRVLSQNVNHLQVYLCGIRSSLIFFFLAGERGIYQKEISCFRVFLEKDHPSLVLGPGKKHHIFGKKIPPFQRVQERSSLNAMLFETTIFSDYLRKISYFRVFFLERSSFIFRLGVRSYFREKELLPFPIIQEREYSRAIFLERTSFQDVWKKNMAFRAVVFEVKGRYFND